MTVDRLIERLRADARSRIEALEADTAQQIAALDLARRAAADRAEQQGLSTRRRQREDAYRVRYAAACRQAVAQRLQAELALLDRVFARAEAIAPSLAGDARYAALLPRQLAQAAAHLGGQSATLRCSPALQDILAGCAAAHGGLTLVADPALPFGFALQSADGACVVDATWSARLEAWRPHLQAALLARAHADSVERPPALADLPGTRAG